MPRMNCVFRIMFENKISNCSNTSITGDHFHYCCFTRANEVCLELVMYFLLYIHHGIVILTATSSLVLTDKCSAGTHNDLITSK